MRAEKSSNEGDLRANEHQHQTPNAKRQTPNEVGTPRVYDLEIRLLNYAARIIRLSDSIEDTKAGNHVGGQLLRSGTCPLGAHGEAQAAESIDDFIHKLKIALKELQESWRWLRLIQLTPLLPKPKLVEPLIQETEELVRIFSKSVRTAESKRDSKVHEDPSEPLDVWLIHPPLAFGVWRLAFGVDIQPPAGPVAYEPASKKSKRRSR